jgi:predicted site-specific integrase-resolvase
MVSEIVVMRRDWLARLGYDLLELIFSKVSTRLVVHGKDENASDEHDLAEDLLAVTTLFVASHHGRRAAANRKRRKQEERAGRESQAKKTREASSEEAQAGH